MQKGAGEPAPWAGGASEGLGYVAGSRCSGRRQGEDSAGSETKKFGTRALATQDAFAMALVQGYCPKTARETRPACLLDGTDAPVDIVVFA
jgi:hypothetical protein